MLRNKYVQVGRIKYTYPYCIMALSYENGTCTSEKSLHVGPVCNIKWATLTFIVILIHGGVYEWPQDTLLV